MKKIMLIFIAIAIFLLGCNNTATQDTAKKVVIRGVNGNVVTYNVNDANQVVKSVVNNGYDESTVRDYSYNDQNELCSIVKNATSRSDAEYVYISSEKNRSTNRVETKTKTICNSRGASTTFTIKYFYDENNNLLGMAQIDENGNVMAKGIEE